jgi:hypothetical protein
MKISEVTKFTEVTYDKMLYENKKNFREIVSEIRYGQFGHPIPDTVKFNGEHVGTYEGLEIFATRIDNNIILYSPQGMTYRGYVAMIDNEESVQFTHAYVRPEFRQMGISTNIILFLLKSNGTKIVISPDEIMTDDSRQLFYKLAKRNIITISDIHTGKAFNLSELGKLFSDMDDNQVGLIVESDSKINKNMTQIKNIRSNKSDHD